MELGGMSVLLSSEFITVAQKALIKDMSSTQCPGIKSQEAVIWDIAAEPASHIFDLCGAQAAGKVRPLERGALQAATLLTHHEGLVWWLCEGGEKSVFSEYAGESDALLSKGALVKAIVDFWGPRYFECADEEEWLPPGGSTSNTHLNAVSVIRSTASLLAVCRSLPLSRQGPLVRRKSIRDSRPTSPLLVGGTLISPGSLKRSEELEPVADSLYTQKTHNGKTQATFHGTLKYDVPPLAEDDYISLREASGGLIRTKVPPYSRMLEAFGAIPNETKDAVASVHDLRGRRGAIRMLSELQHCQADYDGTMPDDHVNANGRHFSKEASPSKGTIKIPRYEHCIPVNEHLLGGSIWVKGQRKAGTYDGDETTPRQPEQQPPRGSPVALMRNEQRVLNKEALGTVGSIIMGRRERRSRSTLSYYGDGDLSLSMLDDVERIKREKLTSIEASPFRSIQKLSETRPTPFSASFKHVKSSLRTASGMEYRSLQEIV